MEEAEAKIEKLREQLEGSDRLVANKNQEIVELNVRLAATNQKILEREDEIEQLESKLATERADREEVEVQLTDREAEITELRSELADLKQKSATARDLPDAVDLTEKAGELLNLFKSLLPKNTKLPGGTISKIEKILEARQDEQN